MALKPAWSVANYSANWSGLQTPRTALLHKPSQGLEMKLDKRSIIQTLCKLLNVHVMEWRPFLKKCVRSQPATKSNNYSSKLWFSVTCQVHVHKAGSHDSKANWY